MARPSSRNIWMLFVLMLFGMVIGGFLGNLFEKYVPILAYSYSTGVTPHTWNLGILELTFGLSIHLNMFGVIGIIIAIFLYRKL